MLKLFSCDCGHKEPMEHTAYYDQRITCPRCGMIHNNLLLGHSPKLMDVFEDSVRALANGHAEKAAQGFAQFYELWLKAVIMALGPAWFRKNRRPNYLHLARGIMGLYGLRTFSLIQKSYRNGLEHDLHTLATAKAATEYAEHVLGVMERNLAELVGEEALRKGLAGELNTCGSDDPEEHVAAWLSYHHHYYIGTFGGVRTAQAWWEDYKAGRPGWREANWYLPQSQSLSSAEAK